MKSGIFTIAAILLTAFVAGPAMADGDAGKKKSRSCAGCHGANGEGKDDNPSLAGMDPAKFIAAMQEYQSGKRDNKKMQSFAKRLKDDDLENLAAYYASLK